MDNVKTQKLRNLAFGKLKENRKRFDSDEINQVVDILNEYGENTVNLTIGAVTTQIVKDIRIYLKFDCLAMWLDWESGLVKYEPDLIEKIAREVGGLKIEGE